jgi:hypothetical protein
MRPAALHTGVLLGAIHLLSSRYAEGQEVPQAPDIQYAVAAQCPDVSVFRVRLEARVAGASKEAVAKSLRALTIRIDESPEGYTGRLVIRDTDGATSARELSAPTCDEVVDAFAVLSALTMGIVGSGPLAPARIVAKPPPAASAPPQPPPPPAAIRNVDRWRLLVGGDVAFVTLAGPTLGFGPEPFVELGRDARGLWSPAFRLSGTRIAGEHPSTSGASASLTLTTLRLDGCPVRLTFVRGLWAAPCLGLRAGMIEGSGLVGAQSNEEKNLWLSLELLARIQWAPLDWLVLEVQGGGSAPFFRYSFSFSTPSDAFYETPILGGLFGGGVGVRFP